MSGKVLRHVVFGVLFCVIPFSLTAMSGKVFRLVGILISVIQVQLSSNMSGKVSRAYYVISVSKMEMLVTWMLCCLDTVIMESKHDDASELPILSAPTLKEYLWNELSHVIRASSDAMHRKNLRCVRSQPKMPVWAELENTGHPTTTTPTMPTVDPHKIPC
jgi:hypothetical protein